MIVYTYVIIIKVVAMMKTYEITLNYSFNLDNIYAYMYVCTYVWYVSDAAFKVRIEITKPIRN